MPWCLPLTAVAAGDLSLAGGKGASLGELLRAGLRVPDGFVVTTEAYRTVVGALTEPDSVRALPLPDWLRREVLDHYARLGRGPVAVRSSATAEDLPGAAFAGQQDTFLSIEGDQAVLDAVRDCWASLFTERAVAYRARLGVDPATVAMAVVVQTMVSAELAGVVLTANPVTGARDQTVVDSSPGLGEAVVAGLVTPDHAVLDRTGAVLSRRAGRAETVLGGATAGSRLSDEQLGELAQLGRTVEDHFSRPMDIEWAQAEGRLWLLQARPMTALPPAPVRINRLRRHYGAIEIELLPRRPLPLEVDGWIASVIGPLLNGMVRGIGGAQVDLADLFSTSDAITTEVLPPDPRPLPWMPLTLLRSLLAARRHPASWRHDRRYPGYLAACRELAATDPARLGWGSLLAVPRRARRVLDTLTAIRVSWLPGALLALGLVWLTTKALRSGPVLDLLCDVGSVTQAANRDLAAMADTVRADSALRAAAEDGGVVLGQVLATDPALSRQLDGFLATYGDRESRSLLMLADPTWGADPAPVLDLLAVLSREPPDQSQGPAAREAQEELLAHPWVRRLRARPALERLLQRAVAGVALREDTHFEATRLMRPVWAAYRELGARLAAAGALDDPDDVWYLTWAELSQLPDPATTPVGRLTAPARRRAAYAELGSTPLISPLTLFGDPSPPPDALVAGTGAGGGRAAGPVRVIREPSEFGRLRPGEVLVCPATNPSWTPLFSRAAAVVVDVGGLTSHAAIVAREYRIPAVMGSLNGTSVLHDGQQVLVDGDQGVVRAC